MDRSLYGCCSSMPSGPGVRGPWGNPLPLPWVPWSSGFPSHNTLSSTLVNGRLLFSPCPRLACMLSHPQLSFSTSYKRHSSFPNLFLLPQVPPLLVIARPTAAPDHMSLTWSSCRLWLFCCDLLLLLSRAHTFISHPSVGSPGKSGQASHLALLEEQICSANTRM